ncbi:hypothetical protein EZV62_022772 [Acer yangbiense]|uniref:DUF4005 domain-containing protein n=1 Tax=Acer yangbiense TaxID=1000413 RepID=A0A5C7GZN6_9ROSI|nr:hypothetical protein EZV62_022772 [Acer yangbiense]
MEGAVVKRQACNTLRCMQTLSRVQSQICSRRIRMSEENQALPNWRVIGEDWDDSTQSKEQVEANLLSKYEATIRRERAMAYSFSHQQTWKNSSRSANPMFMDPRNPSWGWSWLERWMAARPWESRGVTQKEPKDDQSSVKSKSASRSILGGGISRSYARYQLNTDKLSPTTNQKTSKTPSQQSPSTPSKPTIPTVPRKLKSASPKGSVSGLEDDARSMISMQSEKNRRHSIAGSSVRDDESLPSSPAAPRYMVPTESARAKSRLQSPLGVEKNCTPEKRSSATAKKQLSYPPFTSQANAAFWSTKIGLQD